MIMLTFFGITEPLTWAHPVCRTLVVCGKAESLHLEAFYNSTTELWVRFSSSLRPPPSEEKGLNENEVGQ